MHSRVIATGLTTLAFLGGALMASTAPAQAAEGGGAKVAEAGDTALPAPTNVKAKPRNKRVKITWQAPDDPRVNGFEITRYPGGEVIPVPNGTEALVDFGLTNGQTYEYTVESVDEEGYKHSEPVSTGPVTPARKPKTPTRVAATCNDHQLVVTWKPADAGDAPVTSYKARSIGKTQVRGAEAREARFKGVKRAQDVRVQVKAANDIGSGDWATARCT